MNFSEFIFKLGAEPESKDPEFLLARDAGEEFREAARESDELERRLHRALNIPAPANLFNDLTGLAATDPAPRPRWQLFAMAASVLVVVAVAGLTWRANTGGWESVEQYVQEHYSHDGTMLLGRAEGHRAEDVNAVLAQFGVSLAPEIIDQVGLIKYCPTPDGQGAHLVLNTDQGAVTVIFMPETAVNDGEMLQFDGVEAQLVALRSGSAAIIGTTYQNVASLHGRVQQGFLPGATDA